LCAALTCIGIAGRVMPDDYFSITFELDSSARFWMIFTNKNFNNERLFESGNRVRA
jgi:hypothetical protein